MDVWNAWLVVLSVVVLVNLALTLALARRVAGGHPAARTHGAVGGLRPGDPVPDVQGVARDGTARQSEALHADRTLVAFFSPGCSSCKQDLPGLLDLSDDLAEEGTAVLALVDGTLEESRDFVEQIPDHVELLFAPRHDNPALDEFAVDAFPAYALVHGRTVVGSFATLHDAERGLDSPDPAR